MRVTICAVGRMKKGPLLDLIQEYKKRLNWSVTIKEVEAKSGLSGDALKKAEGELLIKAIPKDAYGIALDEQGGDWASTDIADRLEKIRLRHQGNVFFVIGGANGLSEEVYLQVCKIISFGRTTWPHMMVRMMLMEQLYRAQQILKGHPYHRG